MFARLLPALSACLLLSGCFVSEKQMIEESVQLRDGPVEICIDEEPCLKTDYVDGTYLVLPPPEDADEDPVRVNFVPLLEDEAHPVWLGELEVAEQHTRIWAYIVARQARISETGVAELEILMPDCAEADAQTRTNHGFQEMDSSTCRVTDIEAFIAYLQQAHGENYASADWWAEQK